MKFLHCLAIHILFVFGVTAAVFIIFVDGILYLIVGRNYYLGERFGDWYKGVFE